MKTHSASAGMAGGILVHAHRWLLILPGSNAPVGERLAMQWRAEAARKIRRVKRKLMMVLLELVLERYVASKGQVEPKDKDQLWLAMYDAEFARAKGEELSPNEVSGLEYAAVSKT
jgi:hypothetical protein